MLDPQYNEIMTHVGVALGTLITYIFSKNKKLKEGITDFLLKNLNKTKINYIDLNNHKIFGLLRQRSSALATFIIEDPVKMKFYSTYIEVVFKEMENTAKQIIELEKDQVSLEQTTMEFIYELQNNIEEKIQEAIVIPEKVEVSFSKWRAMLSNAFNESMQEILHDDLMDSNYLLAYRILDVFVIYVSILLHTGAVEMSRLNGSFKGLTIDDIIKKEQ